MPDPSNLRPGPLSRLRLRVLGRQVSGSARALGMTRQEPDAGAFAGRQSETFPASTAPPLPREAMPPIPPALLAKDEDERTDDE